jgi:murein DD-endopeptidase MepM/ murein hydrolase activator NlpD
LNAPLWARGGLAVTVAGWLALLVAAEAAAGQPARAPTVHVVKPGESLSVIARRYQVSVPALITANRLSGAAASLRPGQRLVIPAPAAAAGHSTSPSAAEGPAMPSTGRPSSPSARRPAAPSTETSTSPSAGRPTSPSGTLTRAAPRLEGAPPFEWPVEGLVSSQFGRRGKGWHRGIDIQAEAGTPVRASAPGTVVASGYEHRYGLVIKIEHFPGVLTVYAHTLQNLVEVGEYVHAGQVIGHVGRSGRASDYHLHFEIRQAGITYDPLLLLSPSPPAVALSAVADQRQSGLADEDHRASGDLQHRAAGELRHSVAADPEHSMAGDPDHGVAANWNHAAVSVQSYSLADDEKPEDDGR